MSHHKKKAQNPEHQQKTLASKEHNDDDMEISEDEEGLFAYACSYFTVKLNNIF